MSYKLEQPYTETERADFIVEYNHTQGLRIEETDVAIYALEAWEILDGDTVVDNSEAYEVEKLETNKQDKHIENLKKAYAAEENGSVVYKNAIFETSSSNIAKLTSQFAMLQAGIIENVAWLSKDDCQIILNINDVIELGKLMSAYTGEIWNTKYLDFKAQINNAKTLQELNSITILY